MSAYSPGESSACAEVSRIGFKTSIKLRGSHCVRHTIFLFGEAEKGDFCLPLICHSLSQLADMLGNPPGESKGILYAVQALMCGRDLLFFRVKEEGFSTQDYMKGLKILQNREISHQLSAICMPGMGNATIIDATQTVCHLYKSFLIIEEKDLYDYLTFQPPAQEDTEAS